MMTAITPAQISTMVDAFYADIRSHPRLGPIFEARLAGKWGSHHDKLKAFWRSVLLTTGEYNGRPVPVHAAISELQSADFALWLAAFESTVRNLFTPDQAEFVMERARRIARSLWLARFGSASSTPPDWAA